MKTFLLTMHIKKLFEQKRVGNAKLKKKGSNAKTSLYKIKKEVSLQSRLQLVSLSIAVQASLPGNAEAVSAYFTKPAYFRG